MDIFSPEKRSEIMQSVRSKNSKAELIVFRYLRKEGIYFQKHYRQVLGTPDIALPRKKKAVFIDGDFWHGRTIEKVREQRGYEDFWTKKIERNIERDKQQNKTLEESGWAYIRVWESELMTKATQGEALGKIKRFLTS